MGKHKYRQSIPEQKSTDIYEGPLFCTLLPMNPWEQTHTDTNKRYKMAMSKAKNNTNKEKTTNQPYECRMILT